LSLSKAAPLSAQPAASSESKSPIRAAQNLGPTSLSHFHRYPPPFSSIDFGSHSLSL